MESTVFWATCRCFRCLEVVGLAWQFSINRKWLAAGGCLDHWTLVVIGIQSFSDTSPAGPPLQPIPAHVIHATPYPQQSILIRTSLQMGGRPHVHLDFSLGFGSDLSQRLRTGLSTPTARLGTFWHEIARVRACGWCLVPPENSRRAHPASL